MSTVLAAQHMSYTVRGRRILDDISLTLHSGEIYGLVGRNGAGKTTLLSALAGQVIPDAGCTLELFGAAPSPASSARTHLMRTSSTFVDWASVDQLLHTARLAYPGWNRRLEERLIADFGIDTAARFVKLSDGQKSAVGITIALASRAELTLLDEPYSGLDPVARAIFYDRLLEDFAEYPRTFVVSTHLVDEIAPLLSRIIYLNEGKIALDADADDATHTAHEIAGSKDAVLVYLARTGLEGATVRERSIGSVRTAVVAAELTAERSELARSLGVNIQPVSLQEAVAVHSGVLHQNQGVTK